MRLIRVVSFIHYRRMLLLSLLAMLVVLLVAGYCLGDLLLPLEQDRMAEAVRGGATEILDSKGGLIAWRVDSQDSWRVPVGLGQVSPWVIMSIIAAEDQRFWTHCGVDPYALMRALSQNIRHGGRISGASTISMQTMRLLRPAKRNWMTKLREAFQALQTETEYGKEAILELYLNLAPYGGNIIGIEAAARHYFGKSASELTLGEAALLSGIPQSPTRFNPRRHLDAALRRREYVLERMMQTGMVSRRDAENACKEKIVVSERAASNRAPRFADYVMKIRENSGGIISTAIDPDVQTVTESVVQQKYRELSQSGIDGLAVVVLDVRNSELLAMTGNADSDNPVSGFINGATAKRQPGSLLKPFLFCSAYETGLLTPAAVVYDVPGIWKEYRPENIDHDFMGAISAEEALRYSRNIPAVRLLQLIGIQRFADKLAKMGLRTADAVDKYSLSLALGTAEMSLLQLVNAYAALARGGAYLPLKVFTGKNAEEAVPVFTPQSAWLTIESLAGNSDRTLVWKTGTSWNHRDAWAICISPRYAVGVWCGNYSGSGNNRLLGAGAALPLALELAGSIKSVGNAKWCKPEGVCTRKVCALSGCLPGSSCRHVLDAAYIPGVSSQMVCSLHKNVTSTDSAKIEVVWPEDVAAYLQKSDAVKVTEHKAGLQLLSPLADAVYFMQSNKTVGANLLKLSSVTPENCAISYYIDGEYAGRGVSGSAVEWAMIPGYHTLVAATDRSSVRTAFEIKQFNE